MAESPAEFVAQAAGLSEGRPTSKWTGADERAEPVRRFSAQLSDGDRVLVLTLSDSATPTQRRAFERARSAWLAHDDAAEVVAVLADGDDPRPWLAVDPPSDPGEGTVSPAVARSIMIDLAEAFWLIEAAGCSAVPARQSIRLDRAAGTARVCWPLEPASASADGVERIAAIGYELLTGERPSGGELGWPGDSPPPQLWHTIESTLAGSSPIRSCYELKRALLFGPVTPPAGDRQPAASAEPGESDGPTDAAAQSLSGQVSRRTVVAILGVGALGATGLLARGTGSEQSGSEEDSGPPEASFEFEQGRTTMTVTHAGGDAIEAGNLVVRNTRVSGTGRYRWTGFEGYDEETMVREGDSIVIDRGVLSMWYAYVVWKPPDQDEEVILEKRRISEEDLYSGQR